MAQSPIETARILPVAALSGRKRVRFDYVPDAQASTEIQSRLDLLGLRKPRLSGDIRPSGREDYMLTAELGATAVQPCSVTLAPVTTRVDDTITRRFVRVMPDAHAQEAPEGKDEDGIAMIEDDTLEPLGREIDLLAVLTEALALALPDYPRAEGADLAQTVFTEPGIAPMTDEDAKPFAGLAALKDKLGGAD